MFELNYSEIEGDTWPDHSRSQSIRWWSASPLSRSVSTHTKKTHDLFINDITTNNIYSSLAFLSRLTVESAIFHKSSNNFPPALFLEAHMHQCLTNQLSESFPLSPCIGWIHILKWKA